MDFFATNANNAQLLLRHAGYPCNEYFTDAWDLDQCNDYYAHWQPWSLHPEAEEQLHRE